MEKILFPLKYMKQTQGVNGSYSHMGSLAIDYGHSGTKEKVYAPFTGTIKKIYDFGNFVWLESNEKVLFADGTVDYAVVETGHDDDISDLYIGKVIKQGEYYYEQGTSGRSTGVHTHLEVGKGSFSGSGWYKNSKDVWMINNAVHPEDAFFLTDDINVVNDGGYNWRRISTYMVDRDESVDQIEIIISNLRCRDNPNGNILGYANQGIYNILDKSIEEKYTWYKITDSYWVAYDSSWANLYEVTIIPVEEPEELMVDNSLIEEKEIIIEDLTTETNELVFSYDVLTDGMYAIQLYKDEVLKIEKK
ncbi:MAG: hypothetical protein R3Y21_02130 [Mycoplasmatota bacterium]